jgi:CRP-like cAMP-binding protein
VGDIIVLRPDTLIIQIPYNAVLAFKEQEPQLNTLIAVLTNKNKKQMSALSRIMHEREPFRRYLLFANDMSQIHRNLTHTETAEILGISLSSSQRYYKRWLES